MNQKKSILKVMPIATCLALFCSLLYTHDCPPLSHNHIIKTVRTIVHTPQLGPQASMIAIQENPIEIHVVCCEHIRCHDLAHECKREALTNKLTELIRQRNCVNMVHNTSSLTENTKRYEQHLAQLLAALKTEVAKFNEQQACNLQATFKFTSTITRSFRPRQVEMVAQG